MTNVSFPGLGIGPFTMNRFLIRTESVSVAWYGVIICAAMILAAVMILWMATKKEGFVLDSFLDYFIFTIPLGVIGARAMYVLTNLEIYPTFRSAIAVWEGGLAVYGGILTGIVTLSVIAKIKKHNPLVVFDTVVVGVMIAQAIGRWGNFVNGEAHGVVTGLPWGMMIGGEGPFHPTFLYESLLNLAGAAIVIFLLYPRKKFNGEIFLFYLVWYGIGRTLIEGLRTDSLYVGTLRLAQCIGVTTAVLGIVFMILFAVWTKKGIFQAALAVRGTNSAETACADEFKAAQELPSDTATESDARDEEKGE